MSTKAEKIPETQAEINEVTMPKMEANALNLPPEVLKRQQLREQKLKAIRFLEIPTRKSSDLLNVPFDIIDAVRKRFNEDINVSFIIVTVDGEKLAVNKSLNAFTEAYLDYFESFSEDEYIPPMKGYTFVKLDEGGQAGNKPIVLRKL